MRVAVLLLAGAIAGCLFTSPGHADETPNPCASEQQQYAASSYGKPGYDQARQALKECNARASEQKKKEFKETGSTWAAGLDTLPDGGWVLLQVSPDGTFAVFGSRRHEGRKGGTVAVWLRFEYREFENANGTSYKSAVERDVYDCVRIASKSISVTYYSENNLAAPAPGHSYSYDEDKVGWAPAIPGTLGDSLLEWACRASRAQPGKAQ